MRIKNHGDILIFLLVDDLNSGFSINPGIQGFRYCLYKSESQNYISIEFFFRTLETKYPQPGRKKMI